VGANKKPPWGGFSERKNSMLIWNMQALPH